MQSNLKAYLLAAKKAGCPRDQVERFVKAGYIATPEQLLFHAACRECDNESGPTDIGMGGSRGGMKSHAILAQAAIDDCQRVNNIKFLFLRKTERAASESFEDLVNRVLAHTNHTFKDGCIEFPETGSKIIVGGYRDDSDIDKYIGIEYDGLIVEERAQIQAEKLKKLYGSIRTSKTNWRPRKYSSTNPGGVGHAAFVKTFVTPQRESRESDTRFFQTSYRNNPFLDSAYKKWLDNLDGKLGEAWREGNWDVFEGQFFVEFGTHLKEKPFFIPKNVGKLYGSLDYGESAYTSFGLWWIDENKRPHRLFTYYKNGMNMYDYAREIKEKITSFEFTYGRLPDKIFADPSIWMKKKRIETENGTTFEKCPADVFQDHGLNVVRANNDRINGWRVVRWYFSSKDGVPNSFYFEGFNGKYEELIPGQMHDKTNTEDLDTTGEDHIADDTRYFFVSIMGEQSNKKSEYDPLRVQEEIKGLVEMRSNLFFKQTAAM